ncbi:hypothetical protein BE21_02515 [Sorangium cellulosum]|uniref:HTH cro/C1-type domain-containing protein n=1 Tax=Sorangium cellulosum TaxID=56 RepID=A0A150TS74_SORCE|nr:hypothetical protein BE21_02515 [Sorangium cellulosum]
MSSAIAVRTVAQVRLLGLVARGVTQVDVAARVGVSQPTVSSWIAGKKRPAYPARKRALDALDVALDDWDAALATPFRVGLQRGGEGGLAWGHELVRRALAGLEGQSTRGHH